jgi:hypothetical protein
MASSHPASPSLSSSAEPSASTEPSSITEPFLMYRTAANAIECELQDEKMATYKYISLSGLEYLWDYCGEEKKKALLGNTVTNDEVGSALGGATANIQQFGKFALSSAGAISDMK